MKIQRLHRPILSGFALCGAFWIGVGQCRGAERGGPDTGPAGTGEAPATRPAPTSAPANPEIAALVIKLGDDDPATRDEAVQRLSRIGKPALPALREAARGDDPEASARAEKLLKHIERHLPPPGPAHNGGVSSQSVSASMAQGIKTVDVDDNGRKIHVVTQPDGSLEMTVTGIEDGQEATETYKARDAGELKRDNPEAFALYDRWAGQGAHMTTAWRLGPMLHGGINAPPFPPAGAALPHPPAAPQQDLELQLQDANIPPELRAQILDRLKAADALRHQAEQDAEQRVHDRIRGVSPDKPSTREE